MRSSRNDENNRVRDVDGLQFVSRHFRRSEVAEFDPATEARVGKIIAKAVLDPGYPVLWVARDFRVWRSLAVILAPRQGAKKRRNNENG
jgi:hypothetical protein